MNIIVPPFVIPLSQLENGSGGDRCGETCLSAALQTLGKHVTVRDITTYLDLPYDEATSTIYQLLDAAHHFGVSAQVLNNEQECYTAQSNKHICIVLLYNAFLNPLPYPHQSGWYGNHFVVWEAQTGSGDTRADHIMDPLAYPGTNQVAVTHDSFQKAVWAVPIQAWGLSVYLPSEPHKPISRKGPKV